MLTKQLKPTAGGFKFLQENTRMGYCPQNNSLDPNLTVVEMLRVYASLIGFPPLKIPEVGILNVIDSVGALLILAYTTKGGMRNLGSKWIRDVSRHDVQGIKRWKHEKALCSYFVFG